MYSVRPITQHRLHNKNIPSTLPPVSPSPFKVVKGEGEYLLKRGFAPLRRPCSSSNVQAGKFGEVGDKTFIIKKKKERIITVAALLQNDKREIGVVASRLSSQ